MSVYPVEAEVRPACEYGGVAAMACPPWRTRAGEAVSQVPARAAIAAGRADTLVDLRVAHHA